MGENLIEQQIKHFEKRCRIAQIDVKRRSFFERAEIINTVYTVNLNNGSSLKAGDTYLAIVARDGQRIHVRKATASSAESRATVRRAWRRASANVVRRVS